MYREDPTDSQKKLCWGQTILSQGLFVNLVSAVPCACAILFQDSSLSMLNSFGVNMTSETQTSKGTQTCNPRLWLSFQGMRFTKADVNTDVAKSITALDMERLVKAIDDQAITHVDKAGGGGRGRDGGIVAIGGHKARCNNQNVDTEMDE